jgi:hypothetical protein
MLLRRHGRGVSFVFAFLLAGLRMFAQVPSAKHVVLVIDENSSYADVMANMPWLAGQGHANGYAANYKSDNGGSLMDYLWLASGSCHSSANCALPSGTHDFNCNGNDCFYPGTSTTDAITDDNIFRQLNNAGISWKVYAQSYAAAGGTPTTPDNANGTDYYRRHNGATWYSDILSNVNGSANKIVDLSQLSVDLANGALPRFSIIVPDGNHDAHDCPVGTSGCSVPQVLGAADGFLSNTLGPILNLPDFEAGGSGLAIVTFDECAGGTNAGCGAAVYTALIGPRVTPHTVSNLPYKHENTLRTILDSLGVRSYPGAAASAADMADFFLTSSSKPDVVVSSPVNGISLISPVTVDASALPTNGRAITGWQVYVDSASVYSAGSSESISPSVKMSTGAHTLVVRAWDSSGAFGDQTISLSVSASKPVVTVASPTNGSSVGSPVHIQASASASAGHTITGWWVYVDNAAAYNAGSVGSINHGIAMAAGKHTVVIRTWDTSGAFGDKTLSVTVTPKPSVVVSTPSAGANVTSPMLIKASATPTSGHSISGWAVYRDSVLVYQAGAVSSISTSVPAATGAHTLVVRAWDSSGAYGDRTLAADVQKVAVNVSAPGNNTSLISPVAIKAAGSSAHPITGWHIYVDSVDSFGQSGGNSINTSLSLAGGAHTVLVRAWDSTGAYGDRVIRVTVP